MFTFFKKIQKKKGKKDERGITLVIAITMMTLLLSISLSISNIVLRQIRITNVNNASKPAFFTADSAIECAFFYDTMVILDEDGNNTNSGFETALFGNTGIQLKKDTVKCGNSEIMAVSTFPPGDGTMITNFDIDYGTMCAKVVVERTDVSTKISARGYNMPVTENGCDLSDISKRRLVERGLTITY